MTKIAMLRQMHADRPRFGNNTTLRCSLVIVLMAAPVWTTSAAGQRLFESDNTTLDFGVEIGGAGVTTNNVNFGSGRIDTISGENTGDADLIEFYAQPGFRFEHKLGDSGTLYGEAAAIGTLSRLDGDAAGFTRGDEEDLSPEQLHLGWRGEKFDLTLGRQDFAVGNSFLLNDANLDIFDDAVFWIGVRTSWENAAVLKINTNPVRGDLFYLESDDDNRSPEIGGFNLEYQPEGIGNFGVMYFEFLDASTGPSLLGQRDGMEVINLRGLDVKIPGLTNLTLHGEYAEQNGDGGGTEYDADAWYIQADYSFGSLPWTPTLSYRYAEFSGDPDPTDNRREDWDFLFFGQTKWGAWLQGEITGLYLLTNSNQKNHYVDLTFYPRETMSFGAIYYRFYLDQDNYFGIPVTDDHFTDEINVHVDWYPSENFYATVLLGLAFPGDAAEQVFGDDEPFGEVALYFVYKF